MRRIVHALKPHFKKICLNSSQNGERLEIDSLCAWTWKSIITIRVWQVSHHCPGFGDANGGRIFYLRKDRSRCLLGGEPDRWYLCNTVCSGDMYMYDASKIWIKWVGNNLQWIVRTGARRLHINMHGATWHYGLWQIQLPTRVMGRKPDKRTVENEEKSNKKGSKKKRKIIKVWRQPPSISNERGKLLSRSRGDSSQAFLWSQS